MFLKKKYRHALDDYSAAATKATIRVRTVASLLFFASIITLSSLRNSMQSSYSVSEYKKLHSELAKVQAASVLNSQQILKPENSLSNSRPFPDAASIVKISPYLTNRNIFTQSDYDDLNEIYLHVIQEAYIIRLPILGITFHINDLGMICNLSFLFLLIIFSLFLRREEDALYNIFSKSQKADQNIAWEAKRKRLSSAESTITNPFRIDLNTYPFDLTRRTQIINADRYKPYLRHYYRIHASQQLLTITPDLYYADRKFATLTIFWITKLNDTIVFKVISSAFFFLPVISCFFVLEYDSVTISSTSQITPLLMLQTPIFFIVVIFSISCYHTSRRVNEIWSYYFDKIKSGRAAESADHLNTME